MGAGNQLAIQVQSEVELNAGPLETVRDLHSEHSRANPTFRPLGQVVSSLLVSLAVLNEKEVVWSLIVYYFQEQTLWNASMHKHRQD